MKRYNDNDKLIKLINEVYKKLIKTNVIKLSELTSKIIHFLSIISKVVKLAEDKRES